jgi:hypothetical protein
VTLTGFVQARHELPEPRPTFWSMRFMLIHVPPTPCRPPAVMTAPAVAGTNSSQG